MKTPQPTTVQKAVTIVSGGNIGIGVTKPSQKEWSIALEKQIILSIVTAWELGKKQKLTPTRYNLDTKKLGEPIFNLVQLQLAQARTEERKKVIEEVENWLVDEDAPKEAQQTYTLTEDALMAASKGVEVHANNNLRAELRTKLNQLKEEKSNVTR